MKPEYYASRLDALEAKIDALEGEIGLGAERAQAVLDIQNLMGKFTFYDMYRKYDRVLGFFAARPDVSAEFGSLGVYVGRDRIADFYQKYCAVLDGDGVGVLHEHIAASPVVEVARDGLTAKGVWLSPGNEAFPVPELGTDERGVKTRSAWVYGKYAAEFVREDDGWKIWHLQYFTTFAIDFYDAWTDGKTPGWLLDRRGKAAVDAYTGGSSAPTTFSQRYDPKGVMKNWPQPPAAYDTYEGSRPVVGAPPADIEL